MKKLWFGIRESDIRNVLAIIITFGVFITLYLLIVKEIPERNHDVVLSAVGFIFGAAFGAVCGYFFGSSKGDSKKSDPVNQNT